MKRRLAPLVLLVALASTCATPPSSTKPSAQDTAVVDDLGAFADALAQHGMSVGLPPRECDDAALAHSRKHPRYDSDSACLTFADDDDTTGINASALAVYARALVHQRSRTDADARGDALVAAYRARDDAKLTTLATAVERELDDARAHKKPASATAKPAHGDAHVDAGPAAGDAGERDDHEAREAHASEHGSPKQPRELVDGGPAPLTLTDKLIGTWVYEGGVVRNVYALCDDGAYEVKFEILDDSLGISRGDLPEVNGKWDVVDGDPPKIHFSSSGESMDATVGTLSDDAMEITLDGEDLKLTRRAKTASCG